MSKQEQNSRISLVWKNRERENLSEEEVKSIKKIELSSLPKRLSGKKFHEFHNSIFYITKKNTDGSPSKFFNAYNCLTNNFIVTRETEEEVIEQLINNYPKYAFYDK